MNALADLRLRFSLSLGRASQDKMESAGRAEGNLIDTLLALREMDVSVAALMRYAESSEEVPFPKTIPAYPVRRSRRKVREMGVEGEVEVSES